MMPLYEERFQISGHPISLSIEIAGDPNYMDNVYPGTFPNEIGPDLHRFLKSEFPEFQRFLSRDDWKGFCLEVLVPFLVRESKRCLTQKREQLAVCEFPLQVQYVLVNIYRSGTSIGACELNSCRIFLSSADVVRSYLLLTRPQDAQMSALCKREQERLRSRTLIGIYNRHLPGALDHEFTHFFHSCLQKCKGISQVDPQNLLGESLTLLQEYRDRPYIIYPSQRKFDEFFARAKRRFVDHNRVDYHEIGFLMGFFICLAHVKQHLPDLFTTLVVADSKKQKVSLRWANFETLMAERSRPLYFHNVPGEITETIVGELMNIDFPQFLERYTAAARLLKIPKKHRLVRARKFSWILGGVSKERNLRFSS